MKIRFLLATLLVVVAALACAQKPVYWLGTKDEGKLKFDVRIPADAVAVITHRTAAPGRGDDTKPRYKRSTVNVDGKPVTVHATELGWDAPTLANGSLTWTTDAGQGAEWAQLKTSDPCYLDFIEALKSMARSTNPGWWTVNVIVVEGTETEPSFKLNVDGTYGKMAPAAEAAATLDNLTGKADLSDDEIVEARKAFLVIANAARQNPNYRRENKCTKILDLPGGLKPLVLDDALTTAAQDQADYCAKVKQATHSQPDPEKANVGLRVKAAGREGTVYEAAGGGALADCPKIWMTSNTHYRPWWNLDGQAVTMVGFGVRKADDGTWYFVAVLM